MHKLIMTSNLNLVLTDTGVNGLWYCKACEGHYAHANLNGYGCMDLAEQVPHNAVCLTCGCKLDFFLSAHHQSDIDGDFKIVWDNSFKVWRDTETLAVITKENVSPKWKRPCNECNGPVTHQHITGEKKQDVCLNCGNVTPIY